MPKIELTDNKKLPLILFIIGTRPEAIKLVPVILKFKTCKRFSTKVLLTGQHSEMVDQVIKTFDVKTDFNLNIMKKGQNLSDLTANLLIQLGSYLKNELVDLIFVQGDTTTAFAASLAGFYEKIPIAHIEAGLRTNDIYNPFPEELNRRLISQISNLHFAPTKESAANLRDSSVAGDIYITGNTVIDALMKISNQVKPLDIKGVNWDSSKIILVTVHRRENWGENLINICKGLIKIVENNPNVILILPMHKNKIVREPLLEFLGSNSRAILIEPLEYTSMVSLIKNCYLILTDSGGLQEEAPSLGKPVLILRETTERIEGVKAGVSKIIGTKSENIYKETENLLLNDSDYLKMSKIENPYGDGEASKKILEKTLTWLRKNSKL